jgi:hypothetical protein
MTPTLTFACSICGDPSKDICVYCTKDACRNHRCTRCKRCSDCCECEVPLSAVEEISAPEVATGPAGSFGDLPPAPMNAPWVDVVAQEPYFPEPPLEPDPPPVPEPLPRPDPFPQPAPEPRPEPPVPQPRFDAPLPAPPLPHPAEPQPEPEPDNPAPPVQAQDE